MMSNDNYSNLSAAKERRARHVEQIRGSFRDELKAKSDLENLKEWSSTNVDLSDRIPSLLHTVNRLHSTDSSVDLFVRYAEQVFSAISDLGSGADESVIEGAKSTVQSAIRKFHKEGRSPSALYLSYQRLLSYGSITGTEREQAIRAAVENASDLNTEYEATYVLAWYMVESSKYRKALTICRKAQIRAHELGMTRWELAFLAMEGIARYSTFNDPQRACEILTNVAHRFVNQPRVRETDLAYAESVHYLGRCELDNGEVAAALTSFVRAQNIKMQYQFGNLGTAYFHIRMAEALLGARNFKQAEEHLDLAQAFLSRIGNTSAVQVLYDHARANYLHATGNTTDAITLLTRAASRARQQRYARGRLLLLSRLLMIQFEQRKIFGVVATLGRAVPSAIAGELRLNNILGILMKIGRYVRHIYRPYKRAERLADELIECPCEQHWTAIQSGSPAGPRQSR